MNALEFSTKIEKGLIHLPEQFQEFNNTYARIIVLVDSPSTQVAKKEKLLSAFKKMQKIKMFSSIESPVLWQKKIRDEWE